ncbi:hypothetical protein P153DRAFT_434518 [Dothidotthia symphoricarpi CBS 119687]|uniref:Telomeric single stranded DNA binding POT1/Cdc13 domain-containing protein n=1 Tax=Dothidotthia symphoricarpi CBS 119687 TaxID=1392245 RepID=A0A6A6A0X6_9PLEO|nr:uncharacterized protein P153DRAFT_434518 [Dothidotthia symphoricarpi CBS 119687]KAF2125470.1 hypothetical protein P153DRAFT_434518 [Dothidotthia symphoricarpi CBS 119687]
MEHPDDHERVRIAALTPALPAPEGKQFKAVVTLIWPYSSSTRQFALLLAEPELRLRRNKGQVRARFHESSAKAIAATGVGIGDEVVLDLGGAQFVQDATASTPGKTIDWDLSYHGILTARIFRSGRELASLDLVHAAPTPAPQSPARPHAIAAPSPAQQWSSPAFLKRARLSDSPVFDAPHDPFADGPEAGHDKKRRRKSYRDWTAWTYSARTPSPDKEDVTMEDQLESAEPSPSRSTHLPKTPISPPLLERQVIEEEEEEDEEEEEEEEEARKAQTALSKHASPAEQATTLTDTGLLADEDSFVRDTSYDALSVAPDDTLPSDAQFAFGGDTELDTEVEEEERRQDGHYDASVSLTEADVLEPKDNPSPPTEDEADHVASSVSDQDYAEEDVGSATEQDGPIAITEAREATVSAPATTTENSQLSVTEEPVHTAPFQDALRIAMPPPLSILETSFPSGMRTPLGKEPSSPTLKPLDSSTLPLPSPFPGEHDSTVTSYLDHITTNDLEHSELPDTGEEDPTDDADYIIETSFYSSISSSKAGAFHPTHESAFTPVRFTFGMDGAGFSRPLELSSPEPQGQIEVEEHVQRHVEIADNVDNPPDTVPATPKSIFSLHDTSMQDENVQILDNDDELVNTQQSAVISEIIDLGSPSEDDGEEEDITVGSQHIDTDKEESKEGNIQLRTAASHSSTPVPRQDPVTKVVVPGYTNDHSELAAVGHMQEVPASTASQSELATYTSPSQALDNENNSSMEQYTMVDDWEPQLGIDYSDAVMEDSNLQDEVLNSPQQESHIEDMFPGVKMESVEEDSLYQISQQDGQPSQNDQDSDKLLIAVPQEGDKLGKLQLIAVPATGPARNTRSKTKTSMSPPRDDVPTSQRSTRSSGAGMSLTSHARTTISPPRTRGRSTISLSQDASQLSPLDSHSRSRLLSSTQSPQVPAAAPTHWSARKTASRRGINSYYDFDPFQERDTFATSLEPSQELGASQGRYSNVSYVKDSEEDSLHSEHSISTVQQSDDWDGSAMHDDRDFELVTPPRLKSRVQGTSHVELPGEGEGDQPRSSPPQPTDVNESTHSSPPVIASEVPSTRQQSLHDRHSLITPQATQQTTAPSQSRQKQHSVLLTPQLTQTTSSGLPSFKSVIETQSTTESPMAKVIPHHDEATLEVASSPSLHSTDNSNSDDEATLIARPEDPSVGLSTPLAYYTPLKDLVYFLNRSSQFHSSANPDILGLVTSATTPAAKAAKGPQHWNTTLHMTDLSTWPATTTVQIFRAYQTALPIAEQGDVVLLRAFSVKSLNRSATLISTDESSWCVWRYGKPVWGAKRGAFGETRAREEVKGPAVERGEGEWKEVERLRGWYVNTVKAGSDRKKEESQQGVESETA